MIAMNMINPTDIRYIKLGPGGSWALPAFNRSELHFGYPTIPHNLCLQGDWEAVTDLFVKEGRKLSKARDAVREIRDFYTLGSKCLWITFADRHLYWVFSEPEVIWLGIEEDGQGSRIRRTIGDWQKLNLNHEALNIDKLSTKLTQVAGYRQTICSVKESDYLLRRINGIKEPIVVRADDARASMVEIAEEMIPGLHWSDFEVMVDLIFARTGWQRISRIGGRQVDTDLVLEQHATGETAFVQIKSKAGQVVLNDYIGRYRSNGTYDRMFFACHTPTSKLSADAATDIHIWAGDKLANLVVKTGLFDWLTQRSA